MNGAGSDRRRTAVSGPHSFGEGAGPALGADAPHGGPEHAAGIPARPSAALQPAVRHIQRAEPGLDEMLQQIRGLALELEHCIVRLAHTSSAGIPDRDRRTANSSAAEWVRRTLEDIIATSAGIRFAAENARTPAPAAQESLSAAG